MIIKGLDDIINCFPDSKYLAFQYYCFQYLEDEEVRKSLAKDRTKRYQKMIKERLKQGFEIADVCPLIQLNGHFYNSISIVVPSSLEGIIHYFPNMLYYIRDDTFKPRLAIVQKLIEEKFFTPDSGMLFENKFLLGFENRIFDGMPIYWNGDINSLVTLIYLLYFLKIIEAKDNFDTMKHRKRPRRKKGISQNLGRLNLPNMTTFIGGKDTKSKTRKGNFLIKGIDSGTKWDTINRRFIGIGNQIMFLFKKITGGRDIDCIPRKELLRYFLSNEDDFKLLEPTKKDEKIDIGIVTLVYDYYKEPLIIPIEEKK